MNNKLDVKSLIKESIDLAKSMGQIGNYEFIISTYSILSGLNEERASSSFYDYLFNQFNESSSTNFDSFLESIFLEDPGMQIKSALPEVPEKPIEDDLKESESEDPIDSFLKEIGLKDLDETQSLVFLDRFKQILVDKLEVEEEAANLMIYLVGSAKFESEMSPGEKSELLDIISKFQNEGEKLEEADDRDKKIGVIGTIVASTLLFGIGGLLVSGIIFGLSKLSDKDFKKEKDDSDDIFDDVKSGKPDKSKLDKKKADLDSKPEGKPEPPKNLFQAIKQDIDKVKSNLIDKAKKTVDSINKKSVDAYQKGKDKVLGKDPKDMDSKEKKDAQAKDAEKLKPDQYKKKWGKCPKGWRWDSKQNACVKSKQKSESIIGLDDLIV